MNLTNAKLIFTRELRDQLRDRRTLFMIFVLPILLYPLLGMTFLQIMQFMSDKPVRVLVIGADNLPEKPPLIENGRFSAALFDKDNERSAELLKLTFAPAEPRKDLPNVPRSVKEARAAVQAGQYDAALVIPADFGKRLLERYIERKPDAASPSDRRTARPAKVDDEIRPDIIYTTANEKSVTANARLCNVLARWKQKVVESNLTAVKVPTTVATPFEWKQSDVAEKTAYQGAALWAKLLPVVLLLWAMTGAFYPAVDLCAGEKERGTLETLLSSPAERSDIVLGKLATIMVFSMVTAMLNLLSVGMTGWLLSNHVPMLGSPPPTALLWLAIALVPVSALFSALCLALAAFARSTKEGQYYLMPLLLVTMPLALLPMVPQVELNMGTSLIPITGVVLLLRTVLEGSYWPALQFLPIVAAVTLAACLLAIRWAIDQFNSEAVLFSESERLDVGLWLRHLIRDRQATPTVAAAVFCGAIILMIKFMLEVAMPAPDGLSGIALLVRSVVPVQLAAVLMPALLMAVLLTRGPRQTLLLKLPPWKTLPATLLLVVAVHPVMMALQTVVMQLYPINESIAEQLSELFKNDFPLWQLLLLIAVLPAICEELAFRGFILSGFRRLGHKWRAVIYTAVIFGLIHAIIQQQLLAFLVGVVIGYIAVQTGSILPCILFHVAYNSLNISLTKVSAETLSRWPALDTIMDLSSETGHSYHWSVVAAGCIVSMVLMFWFSRLPYQKSPEEELQEAIDRPLET